MSRSLVNVVVLSMSLLQLATAISRDNSDSDRTKHHHQQQQQHVAQSGATTTGYFERAFQGYVLHRRMFLDGFSNGTALLESQYDDYDDDAQSKATAEGEGRGRRKRLRQMNRTLMAIVMAFSLKFMFLIPTFIGTLILLKFTTALAGFFYALFAAVLGLDHKHDH